MLQRRSNMLTSAQFIKTAVALTALFAATTLAVTPLKVSGSDFVNSVDGTRFQMIGVA